MIADKENSLEETKTESKISLDGEERKIIKAKRRFAGNQEAGNNDASHDENNEEKKGKFALKSSFAEVSGYSDTQFSPVKFDFTAAAKKSETGEESKVPDDPAAKRNSNPFGSSAASIPATFKGFGLKPSATFPKGPTMKVEGTDDEQRKGFVQANPLDSKKAL